MPRRCPGLLSRRARQSAGGIIAAATLFAVIAAMLSVMANPRGSIARAGVHAPDALLSDPEGRLPYARAIRREASPLSDAAPTLWFGRKAVRALPAPAPETDDEALAALARDVRRALAPAPSATAAISEADLLFAATELGRAKRLRPVATPVAFAAPRGANLAPAIVPEAPARAPIDRTARWAVDAPSGPSVVILVTALGIDAEASARALRRLPPEIGVAVAPIAEEPARWIAAAQAGGRVALIEAPMEPLSTRARDSGPLTLRVDDAPRSNLARLEQVLSMAPSADGVATYRGDRFTADIDALRPVLATLADKSLFLLETSPTALSQVPDLAIELGLSTAASVVSLDKFGRDRDISDGLALLEAEARRTGRAIGVAVAVPSTIRALEDWTEQTRLRGLTLAPLRP